MCLASFGIRSFLATAVTALALIVAPLALAADSDPWTQKGSALSGSYNGAVALSGDGNIAAVGYPGDPNLGSAATSGAVSVYAWTSGGWVQRGATITGAVTYGFAGEAVALSDDGSTLVVGAPGYCDAFYGTGRLGVVNVYVWNATSSSWTQQGASLSVGANFDCFGKTVALSDDGTKLAVGSPGVDGTGGANSGRVTLYQLTGEAWASVRTIDGQSGDYGFGSALSINGAGTRIAVGTSDYDGRARVFDISAESSSQVGSTMEGQSGQGWGVGKALSLDDSGDVLAVGAEGWGTQRGRVTVYTHSAGVWTPRGAALEGEATQDRSGHSLALSGDGLSVAIGAPSNNAGSGSEGHTRVYRWSGSAWGQRGGDINGLAYQNSAGTWVAIDDTGRSVASNLNFANSGVGEVRVYTQDARPGRPLNVSGTPGNGSVTVSWSPPASDGGVTITGYTATAGTGESCSVAAVAPATPATSGLIGGLTNGASYTFTVTATNAEGTSLASSASGIVVPQTTPGRPLNVSGTPGNGSVTVSWSPPASDGGVTITGYTATAGTGESCSVAAVAPATPATSCLIGGLTNGASYTFTVTATNAAGTSLASSASGSVSPRTTPGQPTSVSGTLANASSVASWSAPVSDGGSTITAYAVTASPGGASCAWSSGPLQCTVSGLSNGASYTFTVTATNAAGTSSASVASAAVTPAVPVEATPTAPAETTPAASATASGSTAPSAAPPAAVTKATAAATRTGGNVTVAVAIPTASIGAKVVFMRKVGNRYVAVSTTKATGSALTIPLKVKGRPGSTQLRVLVGGKIVKSLKV